jgi:hypothetical protein
MISFDMISFEASLKEMTPRIPTGSTEAVRKMMMSLFFRLKESMKERNLLTAAPHKLQYEES